MSIRGPLRRSRTNRMIAGVIGGFADWAGMDATLARVGFVVLSVLSAGFPGTLVYLIAAVVMPQEP